MRQALALTVLALLGVMLFAAGSATGSPPLLAGTWTQAADFYPCDGSEQPPQLAHCTRTTEVVTANCGAELSTIDITRSGSVGGPNYAGGTYTETIHAEIGAQDAPARPDFQPFEFSGLHVGSSGFPVGRITVWEDTFTITSGGTTITGSKSLVNDLANTGVCRRFDGSPRPDGPPIDGFVFILEGGWLHYSADINDGVETVHDEGDAEAYLGDSFSKCCPPTPTDVTTAMGHLLTRYGTKHPASGTTTSAPITPGDTVTPAPGVTLDFTSVTGGTASVTAIEPEDVAAIPSGYLVGTPPMFYDIKLTGGTSTGTIMVCVPYGEGLSGNTPQLLHFEGGVWKPVTTTTDPITHTVCGEVTSLSPFAAVFAPAAPQTTADCQNGGWQTYVDPKFKNQGDCASWVASNGKKPPKG
jgi:hypothetical protein